MSVFPKGREGYATILFSLLVASLLPIIVFFIIELRQGYFAKDVTQYLLDSAVLAALVQVDKEGISKGYLVLEEGEAKDVATEVLGVGFHEGLAKGGLNYDIQVFGGSTDMEENHEFTHPFVTIESTFRGKGIFFSRFNDIKNESKARITWGSQEEDIEILLEDEDQLDEIVVNTVSVVNPKDYPKQTEFPVKNGKEFQLLEHSEVVLNVESLMNEEKIVEGGISLVSEQGEVISVGNFAGDEDDVLLYIPEKYSPITKEEPIQVELHIDLTVQGPDGDPVIRRYEYEDYGQIVGNTNELIQINKF